MSPSPLSSIAAAVWMTACAVGLALAGCGNPNSGYAPVVAAVTSGALPAPAHGVVTLPPKWSGLTPRGTIDVERRADGRLFILFPTFYGRGQDVDGWLYCSGPLTPADFYLDDWGSGGKHSELDACGHKMLSVESQRPPWNFVTRRLD